MLQISQEGDLNDDCVLKISDLINSQSFELINNFKFLCSLGIGSLIVILILSLRTCRIDLIQKIIDCSLSIQKVVIGQTRTLLYHFFNPDNNVKLPAILKSCLEGNLILRKV
jgi:hypothetical protein